MLVHARSGAASFAACLRLFRRYPLAVTTYYTDRGYRTMTLLNRAAGASHFYVLTQAEDHLFVLRSWHHSDGVNEEIRPEEPVPGMIRQVLSGSVPVPRDGALLGWVADNQVTAMLAAYCRLPEFWDDPMPLPEIRVMPMAGTSALAHWPPFTASPLDGRLWDHLGWGEIVDLVPLIARNTGRAFWVPCPERRSVRHGEGYVVVNNNLAADEYWLPAGVYVDHWTLREGIQAPPAGRLLMLPGVVDMARRLR